jgi:hypothetical protein
LTVAELRQPAVDIDRSSVRRCEPRLEQRTVDRSLDPVEEEEEAVGFRRNVPPPARDSEVVGAADDRPEPTERLVVVSAVGVAD